MIHFSDDVPAILPNSCHVGGKSQLMSVSARFTEIRLQTVIKRSGLKVLVKAETESKHGWRGRRRSSVFKSSSLIGMMKPRSHRGALLDNTQTRGLARSQINCSGKSGLYFARWWLTILAQSPMNCGKENQRHPPRKGAFV